MVAEVVEDSIREEVILLAHMRDLMWVETKQEQVEAASSNPMDLQQVF